MSEEKNEQDIAKEEFKKHKTKFILNLIKLTLWWLLGVVGYLFLMVTTGWWMPFVISLFTDDMEDDLDFYRWGGWWGTFDNPPQGDRGYRTKHAPFIDPKNGFQRYINRSVWIIRNSLYNWKLQFAVHYKHCTNKTLFGNPDISDKYKVPGWLFVVARCPKGKLTAWEWYSVTPYSKKRNLRVRLGWKIKGDKFDEEGEFVQMVFTINPFDGYGK